MRKFMTALCLVLAMVTPLYADKGDKKAVPLTIVGDTVLVVKAVPFKVVAPEGAGDYTWTLPTGVEGTNNEDENVLTVTKAPSGVFVIRVKMVTIDFEKKKVIKETGEVTVTLGTPPKPPPDPVKPDGAFGLIKASRDGAALVTSSMKVSESKQLAAAQRTHAAKVAAGVYPDPAKILDAWRVVNRAVFSDAQQKEWSPWAASVQLKLSEQHKAGKLPTAKEWSDAFLEMADGLDPAPAVEKGK